MCRIIFLILLLVTIIMPILLEGSVNKCYGGFGHMGGYKEEECNTNNNDRCYTLTCYYQYQYNNGEGKWCEKKNDAYSPPGCKYGETKNCGQCPTVLQTENLDYECKCERCHGDMCNGNETRDVVNQCYWGNDQNYQAFDCKIDNNMACQKVKCFGTGKGNVTTETVYRDCGKCPSQVAEGCKCFQCSDTDLCNAGFRNGSSFWLMILTMIGGVVSLLANWSKHPLFAIIGI